MYELARGPMPGFDLRKKLWMRWGGMGKARKAFFKPGVTFVRPCYRLKVKRMIKRLTWLVDNDFVKWEDRLLPRKMLWRTVYIKKRHYGLTPKGREYINEWLDKMRW
jgi:hypothetical protein